MNKCVYDCKYFKEYKYQYNGECLKKCPEYTHPNDLNICLDDDFKKCYFTKKEMKLDGKELNYNIINDIIEKFCEEFRYTNNHFSQFITANYSILLYRNKSCLNEFNSNYSVLEFDECIKKIEEIYNISLPLIMIFDRINQNSDHFTGISFFHPITGEKLNATICEFMNYNIYKNISHIHQDDYYEKFFLEYNIDIFDIRHDFYNSICNNYNKLMKKDIILKNRLLYYPNISICDINCIYKETEYKTLTSKCECQYDDSFYLFINENITSEDDLTKEMQNLTFTLLSEVLELFENYKLALFFCLNKVFKIKNFYVNIGGLFLMILLIIQIICTIILIKYKFFQNLVIILYIKKKKKKEAYQINKKNNKKEKEKLDNDIKTKSLPIKGINEIKNTISVLYEETQNDRQLTTDLENNIFEQTTVKSFKSNDSDSKNKSKNYKEMNYIKRKSVLNIKDTNLVNSSKDEESYTKNDILEYLRKSPDDLDFYKARKRDKRSFFIFIRNMIIKKNIMVQTFYSVEETKPIILKIILFILQIQLFFLVNVCLFSNNDITSLNQENNFIFYVKLSVTKAITSITIGKLLRFYTGIFLVDKYTIKELIKLEKDDISKLKEETKKLNKKAKIKYIIFTVLNTLIIIFIWIFVSSFNFAYPNIQIYFFFIYIFIIIGEQIISVLLVFVEACLRFISFKLKLKLFLL